MKFSLRTKRKQRICTFGELIPEIIKEHDIENSFTIDELVAQWVLFVGDIMSTHTKPDRIYQGVLIVSVDHSVYANELVCMKEMILQKIRDAFPWLAIRDIRVDVRSVRW